MDDLRILRRRKRLYQLGTVAALAVGLTLNGVAVARLGFQWDNMACLGLFLVCAYFLYRSEFPS